MTWKSEQKPPSKVDFLGLFPEIADVAAHLLQHVDESLQVGFGNTFKDLVHGVDGELFGGVFERHALFGHHDVVHAAILLGHRAGDEAFLLQVVEELRHGVFVLLDDEGDGLLGERAFIPQRIHDEILLRRQVDAVFLEDLGQMFLQSAIQDVDIDASLFYEYHIIACFVFELSVGCDYHIYGIIPVYDGAIIRILFGMATQKKSFCVVTKR